MVHVDANFNCFASDSMDYFLPYSIIRDDQAWAISQLDLVTRAFVEEPFAFKVYNEIILRNPSHNNEYPRNYTTAVAEHTQLIRRVQPFTIESCRFEVKRSQLLIVWKFTLYVFLQQDTRINILKILQEWYNFIRWIILTVRYPFNDSTCAEVGGKSYPPSKRVNEQPNQKLNLIYIIHFNVGPLIEADPKAFSISFRDGDNRSSLHA